MVHKISNENKIGFLDIDYTKLGQEVAEMKAARYDKPKAPIKLTKQTSGNIYKQKSRINFLETDVPEPEKEADFAAEAPLSQKFSGDFDPKHSGHSNVGSARCGKVGDDRGPSKFVKSESSNSIWNPDRIAQLKGTLDNRETTTADKEAIATNKREAEQKRISDMVERLQSTDQRKDSQVSSLPSHGGHKFNTPQAGMSIFDTEGDFGRVPEKTHGEKRVAEAKQERAERQQNAFVSKGGISTTSRVVNEMFDKLIGK
tara:strand:+ start:3261 stop:4034 length:774 start_codon:yes stop_codon:yes gene_type:complete